MLDAVLPPTTPAPAGHLYHAALLGHRVLRPRQPAGLLDCEPSCSAAAAAAAASCCACCEGEPHRRLSPRVPHLQQAARNDPRKAARLTWHLRLSIALDAAKGML